MVRLRPRVSYSIASNGVFPMSRSSARRRSVTAGAQIETDVDIVMRVPRHYRVCTGLEPDTAKPVTDACDAVRMKLLLARRKQELQHGRDPLSPSPLGMLAVLRLGVSEVFAALPALVDQVPSQRSHVRQRSAPFARADVKIDPQIGFPLDLRYRLEYGSVMPPN